MGYLPLIYIDNIQGFLYWVSLALVSSNIMHFVTIGLNLIRIINSRMGFRVPGVGLFIIFRLVDIILLGSQCFKVNNTWQWFDCSMMDRLGCTIMFMLMLLNFIAALHHHPNQSANCTKTILPTSPCAALLHQVQRGLCT